MFAEMVRRATSCVRMSSTAVVQCGCVSCDHENNEGGHGMEAARSRLLFIMHEKVMSAGMT